MPRSRYDYRMRYNPQKKQNIFSRWSLTNWLILVNIIFFAITAIIFAFSIKSLGEAGGEIVARYIALNPELLLNGYVWTLITSMFMHGGFGHLFVNMVSMFFIGNLVEKIIGRKRFLWFYLIAGIFAGLAFVGLAYLGSYLSLGAGIFGGVDAFAVGASGALFGLGGLLAVLIPRLKVLVFFFIPMPMWLAMAVLMFGLWIVSALGNLPVGNTAHFGGLLVGLAYGAYLRNKYARKIRALNRMFA